MIKTVEFRIKPNPKKKKKTSQLPSKAQKAPPSIQMMKDVILNTFCRLSEE